MEQIKKAYRYKVQDKLQSLVHEFVWDQVPYQVWMQVRIPIYTQARTQVENRNRIKESFR